MMSFAFNNPVHIAASFPFMYSYRDRNPNAILPPAAPSSATTSPPQQPLQQQQQHEVPSTQQQTLPAAAIATAPPRPPQTQLLLSAVEHHAQERNQQLQQQNQLDAAVRLHQLRNSQPTPPKLPSVEPSPPQLPQHDKLAPQLPPLTPQLGTPALHQLSSGSPQLLPPTSSLSHLLKQSSSVNDLSPASPNNHNKPKRKNRPGKKFGAKKRSWVWTWFDQDSADPNVAGCTYCGKIIIRLASDKGSPKKLNEHLKTHKIDINSINYSRTPHIDGHGITYSNSGQPLDYPPNFRTFRVNDHNHNEDIHSDSSDDENHSHNHNHNHNHNNSNNNNNNVNNNNRNNSRTDLDNNRRFISSEFDNSPYTPMKFRTHLLKFLTENKLPISVIKSNSFKQLIYDLRSDSISDLTELTGMYSTLIQVSRFSKDKPDENNLTDALAEQLGNQVASNALVNMNIINNNQLVADGINKDRNDHTITNNDPHDNNEDLDMKLESRDNVSQQ